MAPARSAFGGESRGLFQAFSSGAATTAPLVLGAPLPDFELTFAINITAIAAARVAALATVMSVSRREQIRNALDLVSTGQPATQVARDLGMSRATFDHRIRTLTSSGEGQVRTSTVALLNLVDGPPGRFRIDRFYTTAAL